MAQVVVGAGEFAKRVVTRVVTFLALGALLVLMGWSLRVAVHEGGHLLALMALGGDPGNIWVRVGLFTGDTSWVNSPLPSFAGVPWGALFVSVAGSLTVSIVAFVLVWFTPTRHAFWRRALQWLGVFWVATELVNQAPLLGTDGAFEASVWGMLVQYVVVVVLAGFGAWLLFHVMEEPGIPKAARPFW